jgi:hypothetical protein
MDTFAVGRAAGRRCTDQIWLLDIRRIAREGLLRKGQVATFTWGQEQEVRCNLRLSVTGYFVDVSAQWRGGGSWHSADYQLEIEWLPCRFGGVRPLWVCPVRSCACRAAILYGRGAFACRRCMRLAYRSQREGDWTRAVRRADKIRTRLGWGPGIAFGPGSKPKGMHWKTFLRLTGEYELAASLALQGLEERLATIEMTLSRSAQQLGETGY